MEKREIKSIAAHALRWALLAAAVMVLLLYLPPPFAALRPGITVDANTLVDAAQRDESSQGMFMMTTVLMSYPNFWETIASSWNSDVELLRRKDVLGGRTEQQYKQRQSFMMRGSQNDAIEAAYTVTGTPYDIVPVSILVEEAMAGGEQEETGSDREEIADILQAGDEIVAVNGRGVHSLKQLLMVLEEDSGKRDETLQVSVIRNEKRIGISLQLARESWNVVEEGESTVAAHALGVQGLSEVRTIEPRDPAKKITIHASEIGGPSAGLMFALQIIDEITTGDLTGGMRVAGTGTISRSGEVGAIGGIRHKVAAAERQGAQLFLVPADNAEEAAEKAAELGTPMRIVPVKTLSQALAALAAAAD
ncbi:hypothetical protein K0T92_01135 [Paenibacillus oenotherae]|uniref:endopeptidase La n=1 Tax=Paenibacillus oenotherae TaxID=1435645 RepID=A0ABS7D0E7_9BACL|nr:S16 family serine protease [Paenibacillus oenotherae]MBW7473343.1 hypothetical protein [Paenibacillus oenotherae]